MFRITLATAALITLLGCGSQETATTSTTGDGGTVAATPSAGGDSAAAKAEAELPAVSTPAPTATATNPQVESCLGLVGQAEFSRALPVCLEAARIDPNNADVQAAVEKAKMGAAKASAGAMAEATGAADGVTGAADKAMGDAGSMLDSSKLDTPKLPGAGD